MNIEELSYVLHRDGLVLFDIDKKSVKLENVAAWFGRVVVGDKGEIVQQLTARKKVMEAMAHSHINWATKLCRGIRIRLIGMCQFVIFF